MPVASLRFLHEARLDVTEASRWYSEQDPLVARAFVRALERATATIARAPERWPAKGGTRRYVLKRFPYTIAYVVDRNIVTVVAVAHHRRDQASWAARG